VPAGVLYTAEQCLKLRSFETQPLYDREICACQRGKSPERGCGGEGEPEPPVEGGDDGVGGGERERGFLRAATLADRGREGRGESLLFLVPGGRGVAAVAATSRSSGVLSLA